MQSIVASSRVPQKSTRNVVQTQHLIQFPKQQQSAVRTDLGTMKFQPHPSIKTEPNIARFACTLRVIHNPPPSAQLTC
jgi:hypothetical protein